jgi:ribosomal protein S18 acetylase RimI-like enzyme
MYQISIDHAPKDSDITFIREGIVEATRNVLGDVDFLEKTFSVFLKDKNNNIYGGILARYDLESVYIDSLWIAEKSRHQGYGTKLLNTAESEACKLGCRYSTLDTWSFQAEDFYSKNGYERIGEIKDYWLHHSRIFLRKKL